jgi:hypothetical protein
MTPFKVLLFLIEISVLIAVCPFESTGWPSDSGFFGGGVQLHEIAKIGNMGIIENIFISNNSKHINTITGIICQNFNSMSVTKYILHFYETWRNYFWINSRFLFKWCIRYLENISMWQRKWQDFSITSNTAIFGRSLTEILNGKSDIEYRPCTITFDVGRCDISTQLSFLGVSGYKQGSATNKYKEYCTNCEYSIWIRYPFFKPIIGLLCFISAGLMMLYTLYWGTEINHSILSFLIVILVWMIIIALLWIGPYGWLLY